MSGFLVGRANWKLISRNLTETNFSQLSSFEHLSRKRGLIMLDNFPAETQSNCELLRKEGHCGGRTEGTQGRRESEWEGVGYLGRRTGGGRGGPVSLSLLPSSRRLSVWGYISILRQPGLGCLRLLRLLHFWLFLRVG